MKLLAYSLIKKKQLDSLKNKVSVNQTEITGATQFVKAIEQGNLDVQYNGDDQVSSDNTLATSLISMRDQMKKFAQEEKQRNWVTEGLAKFVDILRSKNDDIAVLADDIIRSLVRYMNANQGALYIVNDDDPQDVYLEMISCYAYERKKHMDRRFGLGEGMVGQAVLEKSTTYMTSIPKDFIRITSGLGEALPRHLLIVPLKIEETVLGVVEIASFQEIKQYQIEFVEKLGESIASTVSAVKVSDRTRKLLHETQVQAEQMRSQEEEMRQNMEELSATQEEMQRVLTEVQGKERYMIDLINASKDSILTVDKDLRVINCNSIFKSTYSSLDMEIDKGFDLNRLFATAEERTKNRALYNRVFNGEAFEVTEKFALQGVEMHYVIAYSPISNNQGEVIAAAVFVKDITQIAKARNEAQQQTEELKAQEEELRQNMEELSATQEEMHRILSEVQLKERYLNEVLNASTDSIFTLDKDLRVISYNDAFSRGLEAMGVPIQKGFELMSIFQSETERTQQRGYYMRAFDGEHFETTNDYNMNGVVSYYVNTYSPLRNESGEVFAIACFAKDVTPLIKAQHEAKEKEAYLNNMLNATTDSILTVDRELHVVLANQVMIKTFRAQGVNIDVGFHVTELAPKGKEEEFIIPYTKAFTGEVVEMTREYFGHHYLITYNPIRDAKREIIGVSLFTKDVTERITLQKKTEELLAQSQQQAEELKAQEEELRQNMEELSATQDEMTKQLTEIHRVKEALELHEQVFGYTTILSESDIHGTITLVNDKLSEVSKYSEAEMIGKSHNLFRHPDMPKELFKILWKTISAGEVFRGIIKNKAKDGTHYWVDATIVPVKDDAGRITKYVGARYHITDDDVALVLYNKQAKRLKLPVLNAAVAVGLN